MRTDKRVKIAAAQAESGLDAVLRTENVEKWMNSDDRAALEAAQRVVQKFQEQ